MVITVSWPTIAGEHRARLTAPFCIGGDGIGGLEIDEQKMTQAFAVFATMGERPAPIFISRIEDSEGRLLEAAQPTSDRVLSPATAYLVTSMLQTVVEKGTARRALALGRPCAGKTGTTNDFRDAWFIGFTPDLVAGVWVGFDSKRSLGEGAAGGRIATPIWTEFMEKALEGLPIQDFQIPTDVTFVNVDEKTGLPVPEGREGLMVITPLWINNATPFLRWSSGDIVTIRRETSLDGPFSVFPVMRHAHRTAGFFKFRGVNMNHAEFEDFIFGLPEVNDFKVELQTVSDREILRLMIEVKRGLEAGAITGKVAEAVRHAFEVRPDVEVLPIGTLAREFESSVKAPRFVDKRQ